MKKKNRLLNIAMFAMILVIILSSAAAVGNLRGWFDDAAGSAVAGNVIGIVNIERSGVAYAITSETSLRDNDIFTTREGSSFVITEGENTLSLNEKTGVTILSASENAFSAELTTGEAFAAVGKGSISLSFGERVLNAGSAVFSVSDASGVITVNVFAGEVELSSGGRTKTVKAGESGTALPIAGGLDEMSVKSLAAGSLSGFALEKAIAASKDTTLFFTSQELASVIEAREAEILIAREEQAAREAELLARGGTVAVVTTDKVSSGGGSNAGTSNAGAPGVKNTPTCTITIRCDTILDNMGDLTPGKDRYVPANGVILATSTVQFVEGETVFDVLKRACDAAGLQLEYSYHAAYESVYIKGINHLYEFDCGPQSGWMYKVNGWFPNYGCSSYTLKPGDVIVWCYTCKGLGADVGGSVY